MSKGLVPTIPSHTNRSFLAKSNLDSLISQGRQSPLAHSFHNTSKSFSLRHDHNNCAAEEDLFNKTASKLKDINCQHIDN